MAKKKPKSLLDEDVAPVEQQAEKKQPVMSEYDRQRRAAYDAEMLRDPLGGYPHKSQHVPRSLTEREQRREQQ